MALYPHGLYNYTTDVQLTILSISFPSSSCNNLFNFFVLHFIGLQFVPCFASWNIYFLCCRAIRKPLGSLTLSSD